MARALMGVTNSDAPENVRQMVLITLIFSLVMALLMVISTYYISHLRTRVVFTNNYVQFKRIIKSTYMNWDDLSVKEKWNGDLLIEDRSVNKLSRRFIGNGKFTVLKELEKFNQFHALLKGGRMAFLEKGTRLEERIPLELIPSWKVTNVISDTV
ncbi:MAG: hypothetical protein WBB45_21225 [Cyclobacteriaceae bacterium]